MKPFGGFAGYSVPQLLDTALDCLADCDREDADFLHRLAAAQPTELSLSELKWLVGICRHVAHKPLPRFYLSAGKTGETLGPLKLTVLSLHRELMPGASHDISYPRRWRTVRTAQDRAPAPAGRGGGRRDR